MSDGDKTFEVVWAEPAVLDLEELVTYIAADAPLNARKVLDRFRKRPARLETAPHRGRYIPELRHFGVPDIRELVIKPYRLVYRIGNSRVIVLALLDGRRDLEELLYERLVRPTS